MIKRKMLIFVDTYSDGMYLANTLYRPAIDVSLTRCDEEEWLYNDGAIRVECYDCIYYFYHK